MGALGELAFHHVADGGADAGGPFLEVAGLPLVVPAVGLGHVRGIGGEATPAMAARVTGDAGPAVKQLYGAAGDVGVEVLPYKAMGAE